MKIPFRLLAIAALTLLAPTALQADATIDVPWFTSDPGQGPIDSGFWTVVNDHTTTSGDLFVDSFEGITGGTFDFETLSPGATNYATLEISLNGSVTGGTFNFYDYTSLFSKVSGGVSNGTFTFHDHSQLGVDAFVTDAVTGGDFSFLDQASFLATEYQTANGTTLKFFGDSSLTASTADSIVNTAIELNGSSRIHIGADDALCDGSTITFSDAGGGDGGRLTLNGYSVPIGWINSAAGGIIANDSIADATLTLSFDTDTKTFNGAIEDGAGGGLLSLVKSGTGTQVLGGTNTYTGGTTIADGTLELGSSGTALSDDGAVDMEGGTLRLGAANETIGTLSGFSGTVDLTSGFALTINQGTDGLYSGGIAGGGALVKDGLGMLELDADNSGIFAGDVTVSAGILRVNNVTGSATGDGTVTIGANGTLDGHGSVGNVIVRGTISPGVGSVAAFAVSGTTTLDEGGIYAWDVLSRPEDGIPGGDWDLIATDALVISATSGSRFTIAANTDGQLMAGFDFTQDYKWTIVSAASGLTGSSTDKFAVDLAGFRNFAPGTFTVIQAGNDLQVAYNGVTNANVDRAYTTSIDGDLRSGTVSFDASGGSLTVDIAGGAGGDGSQDFHGSAPLNVIGSGSIDGGAQLFYDHAQLNAMVGGSITGGIQEFYDSAMLIADSANAVTGGVQRFYGNSQGVAAAAGALSGANILLGGHSALYLNVDNAAGPGATIFMDGSGGNAPRLLLGAHDNTIGGISSSGAGALITNEFAGGAASLTLDYDGDYDIFSGRITDGSGGGAVTILKAGSGILELSGNMNDYTGNTSVTGTGALVVTNASGSATGTGNVTIGPDAALAGNGLISGAVTLDGTILPGWPGSNPGAMATLSTGAQLWNPGAGYVWDIGAATGAAGTNWDTLAITGGLDIGATVLDPFHIVASTLDDFGNGGFMADFDSAANYDWTIASTTTGITNFAANRFALDLIDWVNPYNGAFSIVVSGNNLNIHYAGAAALSIVSPYVTSIDGSLASAVRAVTAGTVTSDTVGGLSGGQQNFINSTLHASVANAVTGGYQIFSAGSVLDAAAANAITGGQQHFHDTSTLEVNAVGGISGGRQKFYDTSALDADAASSISGSSMQDFFDQSALNASVANAVVDGTQVFSDTARLNVTAAGAVSGGSQIFLNDSSLEFTTGGSVSGGQQNFYDTSTLNADVAGAVTGGIQGFHGASTLVAGATNAVSGGFVGLLDHSTLVAGAAGSVQNSTLLLEDESRILVASDEALSATNAISFDNHSGGTGGFLVLDGRSVTVGLIDSVDHSGNIRNGAVVGDSVLTVDLDPNATTSFGGVVEDGAAATLALVKTGAGTLELFGAGNTYTGGTTIAAGTLLVNNIGGNALGGGPVTIGAFGTLGGKGFLASALDVSGTLAPGPAANAIGRLSTGDQTWNGGGVYQWQINDADGVAGTGYDQLEITGGLNILATSGDKFVIPVTTLDASNVPGFLPNFDTAVSHTWLIATTTTGLANFDVSAFTLDLSGFANAYNGVFTLSQNGNSLVVDYAGAAAHSITSAYLTSAGGDIATGVWEVTSPGSITADTSDGISGGEVIFRDGTTLDATVPTGVSGGRLIFHGAMAMSAAVLNANAPDSVVEADITLFGYSRINVNDDDGVCDFTNITFDKSEGGVGGTLTLNGYDIPIGAIDSVGGGGVITNASATDAQLSLDFDDLTRTYGGLIEDGGAGALAVSKNGTGTQVLSGANTYSGGTTLFDGILGLGHANALGTGPLTILGGTLLLAVDANLTLPNSLVVESSFTIAEPTFAGNSPVLTLGGSMTLFENVTITNHSYTVFGGDIDDAGAAHGITFRGPGFSELAGHNTYTGPTTIYSTVAVSSDTAFGTGIVTFQGANGSDPGGFLVAQSVNVVMANDIVLGSSSPAYPTPVAVYKALTLNGAISGVGGLTVFGPDILTLAGDNSYQLGTNITGGTVAVGHDHALGSGPVVILGQLNAVNGPRSIANPLEISGATFGGTDSLTFTGSVSMRAGFPVIVETQVPVTFDGVVSGGPRDDLIKDGPETLTLNATNTYTGETFVASGTLVVNGSIAASPLTSVSGDGLLSNGTLAGTGTIGALAIDAYGTLSPGNAASPIGVLSTATETWGDDGAFAFEINNATGTPGTNWDSLNIAGSLAITADALHPFVFQITTLNGLTPGAMANYAGTGTYQWLVATTTGGITGLTFPNVVFDTTGFSNPDLPTFNLSVIGNSLYLVAVPEPAAWGAMMGCGLFGLAILRRRFRSR